MSLDKIFEALASGPRRQILAYLSEAELTTTQLSERFAMSKPAISRHLSVLENAGLVSSERQGQFVMYRCWRRPNFDHPRRLNLDQGAEAVAMTAICG
ncbi:MAG: ArsR family transcriptional regulator [Burkholderiales bacterium]|nr:MAG: ArsR family transcriptional regulator [Burkholderiales bacterium]